MDRHVWNFDEEDPISTVKGASASTASSRRSPPLYPLYFSGSSETNPEFVSVDDDQTEISSKSPDSSTSYSSFSPSFRDSYPQTSAENSSPSVSSLTAPAASASITPGTRSKGRNTHRHQKEHDDNACSVPENMIDARRGIWHCSLPRISCVLLVFSIIFFILACVVMRFHSKKYVHRIAVERLHFSDFWIRPGLDLDATTVATVNCTLTVSVYNPAPYFTMHIHTSAALYLAAIPIATTVEPEKLIDVKRKTRRTAKIRLDGKRIPLYGAAAYYVDNRKDVGLTLEFHTTTKRTVLWKFVETSYRRNVSCTVNYRPWVPIPSNIHGDDINCTY